MVRSLKCIRPISHASELAAAHDGLIINRYRSLLEDFWGAQQMGGVMEALAAVVCIALLCQLRFGMGCPTFLFFADLESAFDTISHDDIRLALFAAHVVGCTWLIIDDLLRQDLASILLHGVSTDAFRLDGGTAQGRKISSYLFNCVMRFLHDIICQHS